MDWSRAVVIAVVMMVVPLALKALASSRGAPPRGQVRYSAIMKGFALFMTLVPTMGVGLVASLQKTPLKPEDLKAIAFIVLLFLGLGVPLVVEFFGVRHTFDGERLDYRAPWTRRRSVRWAEVASLKWSQAARWLVLRDGGGAKYRLSPLLGGLSELAKTAQERIPAAVLEASPGGAAVLELMRRGQVLGLVMSRVTPEMQVRDLPPEP